MKCSKCNSRFYVLVTLSRCVARAQSVAYLQLTAVFTQRRRVLEVARWSEDCDLSAVGAIGALVMSISRGVIQRADSLLLVNPSRYAARLQPNDPNSLIHKSSNAHALAYKSSNAPCNKPRRHEPHTLSCCSPDDNLSWNGRRVRILEGALWG